MFRVRRGVPRFHEITVASVCEGLEPPARRNIGSSCVKSARPPEVSPLTVDTATVSATTASSDPAAATAVAQTASLLHVVAGFSASTLESGDELCVQRKR